MTAQRITVATTDPDVSAETVRALFGNPLSFESDPAHDFSLEVDGTLLASGLTAAAISAPTSAAMDLGEMVGYSVSVMEGDVRWTEGGVSRRIGQPLVIPPGASTRLRWTTARTWNVGFPADRLAAHTGGAAPSMADLNREGADTRALSLLVRMLNASLLSHPDVLDDPLIQTTALETLLAVLAATFPVVGETVDSARPTALRRATAFIDEHLADPVTIVDIAAAARMSVRGVQALFRRELGTPPLRYLRQRRLAAARADLVAASEPAIVALIARRWGFADPSRFAVAYLQAYGEQPSVTLRR